MRNLLLACLAGAALSVAGAEAAQPADPRQACAADVKKLCSGVQPGGGRILQCMKSHAADVSSGCKAALIARRRAYQGQSGAAAGHPG